MTLSPGEDLRLFDADPYRDAARILRERFIVPPFSVMDASKGYWQERKRNWLSLGIESEVGRDTEMIGYSKTASWENAAGSQGSSIFDPVLCELVYRWWSPAGGLVLDPFAGGSVRGVVAHMLGRSYVGVELRPEQVAANYEQSRRLRGLFPTDAEPVWHTGDSLTDLPEVHADLIFTCPPYGDLEVYSDDPRDLSNMEHGAFGLAYRRILAGAARRLHADRFAVIIVGNYRDKRTGALRDLAAATVGACESHGLTYYADSVLATSPTTTGLRVSRSFPSGRKPGRRHQNVLVFVKGDWRKAAAACEPLPGRDAPQEEAS